MSFSINELPVSIPAAAKKVFEKSASFIEKNAVELQSPALSNQARAARQDARALENESDWNRQRKSFKARSYKLEKQQSY